LEILGCIGDDESRIPSVSPGTSAHSRDFHDDVLGHLNYPEWLDGIPSLDRILEVRVLISHSAKRITMKSLSLIQVDEILF